ncbi:MAG: tetratricopeptide repeat protein [Ignavibacteria bacterium]|nr:tetratricopeptide repeat protein [Ignavibacteria bacterium]
MKNLFVSIFILSLSTAQTFSQSSKDLLREGNGKYKSEKYNEAEILYRKSLEKDPKENRAVYNLGNSLYKQDKTSEARNKYNELLHQTTDPREKAKIYYNIGNSFLKEKKYRESIEYYKKSLRLNPKDFDSKYNLEYAKRMLIVEQNQQKQNQQSENKQNEQQQSNSRQSENEKQNQKEQENQPKPKISKENIENILNALRNEERKTQKEAKAKMLMRKERVIEKNW